MQALTTTVTSICGRFCCTTSCSAFSTVKFKISMGPEVSSATEGARHDSSCRRQWLYT